jgi:hypothetical protein
MSSLNNRIAQLSTQVSKAILRERTSSTQSHNYLICLIQATRLEKLARDKEAKFASEQKLSERKVVLSDSIGKCAEEEKKVSFVSPAQKLHSFGDLILCLIFLRI